MFKICRIILLFFSTTCWLPVKVLPQEYSFTQLGPKDGLASSEILELFQDSQSFLWIGHAAGVSRYDGYRFDNFLTADKQRVGLTYRILEDEHHNIWIGSEGGLFIFRQNKLQHISFTPNSGTVFDVAFDSNGGVWIGTTEGPAYLNKDQLQKALAFKHISLAQYILPQWRHLFLTNRSAKYIKTSREGTIFISNSYVLYKFSNDGFQKIWQCKNQRDLLTDLVVWNRDSIYLTTQNSGLQSMENGHLNNMYSGSGNGNALIQKRDRLYYFATENVFSFYPSYPTLKNELDIGPEYWTWGSSILLDNEDNFWIGTHQQLIFARRNLFAKYVHPEITRFDELYSAYQLKDGTLIFGGNRGTVFKKITKGDSVSFTIWKKVFELAEVHSIYEDANGDIWFGSGYQGISLLQKNQLKTFTTADGLRDNTNLFFLTTKKGELFTGGDRGISQIIQNSEGEIHFKNFSLYTGNNYPIVTCGIEKPDGNLLFGSNWGLLELNKDSLQPAEIKNADNKNFFITDIKKDADGNIWLTTNGDGILVCYFDKTNNLILKKHLTKADGLLSEIYLQLLVDRQNIIWAGNYSGVTRIETNEANKYFIANFSQQHGFISNTYMRMRIFQDKQGIIWFATTSGLASLNPAHVRERLLTPQLKLTGVSSEAGTNLFKYAPSVDTLSGLPLNLKLPYRFNNISFQFSGIHLSNASSVTYSYRLSGADTAWIDAGNNRQVNFQNLSNGNYVFQVKASAGTNQWSKIIAYSFAIKTPYWQSWWFILLSLFFLSALIIYFIKKREKSIKANEAQKTELQKLRAINYQYQLETEQVINYFAKSMAEQETAEDILWDVAKNCISKLGFQDCVIYLKDEQRNVLVQKAAWGPKTTELNKILNPIEIPIGMGIVGAVAESGKAEIIPDTSVDSRYIVDDAPRQSEIAVPMLDNGKVIGVIDSEHPEKNFYTQRHLQILTTIASQCADKINKVNAAHKVRENEVELITMHRDLATSQLTALRAQMNPHFIFNALNSIQQYILRGDVDEANKYLSKFSRLQRAVLNHCDQSFITLEKEVEMLELYLQLEQLRFDGSFEYHITLTDDIDLNEIKIPPMMLQPFVENAIWHGLSPKKEHSKVDIKFSLQSDDLLNCTISDNGIGRAAAAKFKQNDGTLLSHKSKGLPLVYERMKILQQQYQQPFDAVVADITDAADNVLGTQVKLIIYIGN